MKNSPHRQKHMQHKAIRAACHINLNPTKEEKNWQTSSKNNLKPLNINRCKDVLNLYKKHLEQVRFYKNAHNAKRSTPGEIHGSGPYTINPNKNPNKVTAHWRASDLERSRNIARKMLKQSPQDYKKAA